MSFAETLTPDDRAFLQDNFQIYDPDSRGFHTDFGILQGRKVIFLGELHHIGVCQEMHNAFLKRFGTNQDGLLIESYPPDQKAPRQNFLILWPDLPEGITILGSDNRQDNTQIEKLQQYILLNQKYTQLLKQPLASVRDQEMAHILNAAVRNSSIRVAGQELQIPLEDMAKCRTIVQKWLTNSAEEERVLKEIENLKIPTKQNATVESNRGLAQTVINAAKIFRVVFAIWGMGHLIDRCELYQLLQKHGISYAVLVPSKKRAIQIKQEKSDRRICKLLASSFDPVKREGERRSFSILNSSLSYFHPVIQAIIQAKPKKEKIFVSAQWLKNSPSQRIVPARTGIYFENAPLGDQIDDYMKNELPLWKVLDLLCLRSQREIEIDAADDAEWDWKASRHPFTFEPLLRITYTKQISMTIKPLVRTTLANLVAHMQHLHLGYYEVEATVPILLEGYSTDQINTLFANININFPQELSKYAPASKKLVLVGKYRIEHTNDTIVITGATSLKFVIVPSQEP